jgi:Domain of unknown function (DUF4168)
LLFAGFFGHCPADAIRVPAPPSQRLQRRRLRADPAAPHLQRQPRRIFMPRTRPSLILGGIAAALLLLVTPQAFAQQQPPPANFSQEKIEAFVDAAIEVQRVQTDLDTQAQQAQSPEEVTQLQQQAQADASQAVEAKGLSVDEYTAIAQAANEDPQLYAMIVDLMQKRAPQ